MELRTATAEENAAWERGWLERIEPGNRQPELRKHEDYTAVTFTLVEDGADVGVLAMTHFPVGEAIEASVNDVWIAPEHRRRGLGRKAAALAADWARERGARALHARVKGDDAAAMALFASYNLTAQHMVRDLGEPTPLPEGVEAVPLAGDAYETWLEHSITEYAKMNAESGFGTFEEAYASAVKQFGELLPQGTDTPGHALTELCVDGEQVAAIWVKHGYEPGTSFVFDVESSAKHRGKGYGRAAMHHGENLAIAAGDTRMMLNVHGHNTVAISLYEKLGYRVVRQFRNLDLRG